MKHWTLPILVAAAGLSWGCEENDLGRYCIVGQAVPKIEDLRFSEEYQPSVTILNLEAPECQERLCIQQGPYARYPNSDPGSAAECPDPYTWYGQVGVCAYKVRAFCSHECKTHKDCSAGGEDSNGDVCSEFVCHKQAEGEAFAGHCICVCKDFLIKEGSEPRRFYHADETVPDPTGCK